jgi:hypothetical protein
VCQEICFTPESFPTTPSGLKSGGTGGSQKRF